MALYILSYNPNCELEWHSIFSYNQKPCVKVPLYNLSIKEGKHFGNVFQIIQTYYVLVAVVANLHR